MDFFRSKAMRRVIYGIGLLLALSRFLGHPHAEAAHPPQETLAILSGK